MFLCTSLHVLMHVFLHMCRLIWIYSDSYVKRCLHVHGGGCSVCPCVCPCVCLCVCASPCSFVCRAFRCSVSIDLVPLPSPSFLWQPQMGEIEGVGRDTELVRLRGGERQRDWDLAEGHLGPWISDCSHQHKAVLSLPLAVCLQCRTCLWSSLTICVSMCLSISCYLSLSQCLCFPF